MAPKIFFGKAPEFLEWDYKIQPDSDHVAKFQGDRSRELKETVAKKRKKDALRVKHNRPELIVPGGLKTTAVKHKVLEDLKSTYANSRRLYGWSPLILAFSLITYTPHGRIRYVTLRWAHFWLLFVHGNVRRHSATVSCLLLFTSALVLRCRQ